MTAATNDSPDEANTDEANTDEANTENESGSGGSDPFHDFTVPQDADFVAAPTPNAESDDSAADDADPLGENE